MTAGILAILQGTLTLSLSVTGYYATLTAIFPIAVLTLRFFIPTKEPLRKQEVNSSHTSTSNGSSSSSTYIHGGSNSSASDMEVYLSDRSVHNPTKSLLGGGGISSSCGGSSSSNVYREELLFVKEYYPLLSLQLLNASLAYG